MSDKIRNIVVFGGGGLLVASALASPALFHGAAADEPAPPVMNSITDLFPPPFDPSRLKKFAVTFDDSVSTKPKKTETVTKIAYGHKSIVSITTTASGTYSSDGIASPNVLYPGIEVGLGQPVSSHWVAIGSADGGTWTSYGFTLGSITYIVTGAPTHT